ncbi:MAG: response regulator [Acidobacteria bacterium]|nr:response regulator [Acidobacteriota bacterium]
MDSPDPQRLPVLLVGTEEIQVKARLDTLSDAGFTVLPVRGFLDARQLLAEQEPEAIVTDVHLGDYNGLHLVAIAQVEHPRTACLVTGPRDPALQAEAYHLGARYLVEPVTLDRLAAALAEVVANPRPQRRWPRRRPATEVVSVVAGVDARIVDVSYGGAGIEFFGAEIPTDQLELVVPATGLTVPVERVWTRQPGKAQPITCGLALRRDSAVDARWRTFVDGLELLPGILPTPGGSGLPA